MSPPLRVVVLGGGRSSEHEVSLASAASVAEGLRTAGHDVLEVTITRDRGAFLHGDRELTLSPGGGLLEAEVVFPALHGPFGEDGTIQGLLEYLDVPYVGADLPASALCLDKLRFKEVMAQAGIAQVAYTAVSAETWASERPRIDEALATLGFPVFVKPARLGSSVGIARVDDASGLHAAIGTALGYDPRVIVEAACPGLEVECSVLGNRDLTLSPPGEIRLAAGEAGWYDYAAKYTPGGMELIVPARISSQATEALHRIAAEAFRHAGCTGLARADFFVDGETVLLNELNTMPGFTATSVYAALFAADGLAYRQLLDRLLRLALERHAAERAHTF